MKKPATVVRFRALEVLALVDLAISERFDELWLVRGESCRIQTPDVKACVEPVSIDGDQELAVDHMGRPRVEVVEMHNHVVRTLRKLDVVNADTYVEAHFTSEEEFCLVLCCGLRNFTEEKPLTWMSNVLSKMGRMF